MKELIVQKLEAIGIEATGTKDGLPTLPGRFLKYVDGTLRVFFDRKYKRWESPEEDTEFDSDTLSKIHKVLQGESIFTEDDECVLAVENEAIDGLREEEYRASCDQKLMEMFDEGGAYLDKVGQKVYIVFPDTYYDTLVTKLADWKDSKQAVKDKYPKS